MKQPTDVEISRTLNALSATLNEQRPPALERERLQAIADGAVGHEPLFVVTGVEADRATLLRRDDNAVIAHVRREGGGFTVERVISALGSDWAVPRGG